MSVDMSESPPPEDRDSPKSWNRELKHARFVLRNLLAALRKLRRRCKDMYRLHFPELYTMISDDALFFKIIRRIGRRDNVLKMDLTDVIPPTVRQDLEDAARSSNGQDLTDPELEMILTMCDTILLLMKQRTELKCYMANPFINEYPNITDIYFEDVLSMAAPTDPPAPAESPVSAPIVLDSQTSRLVEYVDYHYNLCTLANCAAAAKCEVFGEGSILDDASTNLPSTSGLSAKKIRKTRNDPGSEADDEASDVADERPRGRKRH